MQKSFKTEHPLPYFFPAIGLLILSLFTEPSWFCVSSHPSSTSSWDCWIVLANIAWMLFSNPYRPSSLQQIPHNLCVHPVHYQGSQNQLPKSFSILYRQKYMIRNTRSICFKTIQTKIQVALEKQLIRLPKKEWERNLGTSFNHTSYNNWGSHENVIKIE